MNRDQINYALMITETMDGLSIEGNNHKLSQFLSLREHLIEALAELDRYSISAGLADQFKNEAKACRKALGFSEESDCVSPSDLIEAINRLKS